MFRYIPASILIASEMPIPIPIPENVCKDKVLFRLCYHISNSKKIQAFTYYLYNSRIVRLTGKSIIKEYSSQCFSLINMPQTVYLKFIENSESTGLFKQFTNHVIRLVQPYSRTIKEINMQDILLKTVIK